MFKEKLALVPEKPGCYLHKDKNGNVIYVGKAKNLKRRVSSYFNKIHTGKTKALVDNISDFEYIVTNSEMESFILEINLIKKYDKNIKLYPGHGDETSLGYEIENNIYMKGDFYE